ncbi:MAG: hypothetical protein R6V85_19880 [Polyangia bacterium]
MQGRSPATSGFPQPPGSAGQSRASLGAIQPTPKPCNTKFKFAFDSIMSLWLRKKVKPITFFRSSSTVGGKDRAMAWLGERLPDDQQEGRTPFAPRCVKDLIEEELFSMRRDLFTEVAVIFFDTTTLYFEGKGGQEFGRRGKSKDVAKTYKMLWMVEHLFRTVKFILDTRPIYHKWDETIRGHVFCSFLALILMRELQDRMAAKGHLDAPNGRTCCETSTVSARRWSSRQTENTS